MGWVTRTNLKGPTGTIDSATASALAPDDAPTVSLGGTPSKRSIAFGIPRANSVNAAVIGADDHLRVTLSNGSVLDAGNARGAQGLPGTNAVPTDDAVAGYISTSGTSATKLALAAHFSAVLVYESGAYPVRPDGATSVTYIGPVAPTDWLENDTWKDNS